MSKGAFVPSEETRLVYEFYTMKNLKKLGFVFDARNLTDIDACVYNVISDEVAKIEKSEIEKSRKTKRR